jgi:nucleosome binding factor SPN SPT16 subunit
MRRALFVADAQWFDSLVFLLFCMCVYVTDLFIAVCTFLQHSATVWGKADYLLLHRGPLDDDNLYQKSSLLHQWLFGYELPDTVLLLRKDGNLWFLATNKKCDFLKPAAEIVPKKSPIQAIHLLLRNKADNNAGNYQTLLHEASLDNGKGMQLAGMLVKERDFNLKGGGLVGPWEEQLDKAVADKKLEIVDITQGLSFCMSIKDDDELDALKKSSVLSNKVMKHGYVKRMEEIIDSEQYQTHEALATYVESVLEDPSLISLKVPKEDVQSCYFPIVQSGGQYDLRVSAQSTSETLSPDVILVSLGARYRNYCSNIARTFLVDPPKKVSETYELLLELQEACLEVMKPGNLLKDVYKAAVRFLKDRNQADLIQNLPKNLGFATGLDFREGALVLSSKNAATIKKGMVFCLTVGFQDVPLSESDRNSTPDKSAVSYTYIHNQHFEPCMFLTNVVVIAGQEAIYLCFVNL